MKTVKFYLHMKNTTQSVCGGHLQRDFRANGPFVLRLFLCTIANLLVALHFAGLNGGMMVILESLVPEF